WLWVVALFSLLINLLYLTGPIFMLQIYDRVLASANVATLIGLLLIVVLLYLFFGVLEFIRTQVVTSNGETMTERLAHKAYQVSVLSACEQPPTAEKASALDDVATLRSFLVSPTFTAIFDLPWAPIFLLFVFALHPVLGAVATVAALLLSALAIANERISRARIKEAAAHANVARRQAMSARRNADALRGNGMIATMSRQWRESDHASRTTGVQAIAINSSFSVSTKTLRLAIQSGILAVGAYFTIRGELTPGSMIAGSIVFARALAPLEQILGNFTGLARARDSWTNIGTWRHEQDQDSEKQVLPRPNASLEVSGLSVAAPGHRSPIVTQIGFKLQAGDVLGVMGPSGSGKSTLGRALAGAWPALLGKICLDGAELGQWPRDALGRHIGFLPQDIELFNGSIAQNIARFDPDADFEAVLRASQLAGTHQMVLALEDGYNTVLGEGGAALSAGQRQRVALARALFGSPFLLVLDEPNSNLDAEGDRALGQAMAELSKAGCITVVIAHRQNVLAFVNKLLILHNGQMVNFGPRDDVLKALQEQINNATRQAANA
ncbi:MAG: type I secretion system permease/ATPase, partial [Gammaproteobacteria bacterium]|nr:type I secretion system permease/ATPase [Gammaproteobacteria bacterium]